MAEFVRARHEETGHVAALDDVALKLGMHPGWVAVDGPAPDGPKIALSLKSADGGEESGGEKPAEKKQTAGGKSAEKKE